MPFSDEERSLLAPYVTSLDAPIFALKGLPEEVVAVLFAYYSRSREDLRANLLRLLRERDLDLAGRAVADPLNEGELETARRKAREFHEKWVVGYGHASVIEDARLASYTEKSTRYVPFPRKYYQAPELPGDAAALYHGPIGHLFDEYEALLPLVQARVMERADRSQFKTDRGFENSCLAQACDALRYLLPAATHTNIGLTANARTLEHLISKLLSHPLAELRDTGERIREEVTKLIPTLIKYARRNDYAVETPPAMTGLAAQVLAGVTPGPEPESNPDVRLITSPPDAEARLAAAILYEFSDLEYEQVWERVRTLSADEHLRVIHEYLARRKRYGEGDHGYTDPPLRSLEHLYFTFEVLVDYGAYRDIQRHRMATQTTQRLGCLHGYDVPELLEECGYGDRFRAAMEAASDAWARLAAERPEEAQYVTPLAFRKRVLFTWNLRALHHFVSLRSARQGHLSYRRVAWGVYDRLQEQHPALAEFIRVDRQDYALARPG
jgi:thymidylate synthase ThyX